MAVKLQKKQPLGPVHTKYVSAVYIYLCFIYIYNYLFDFYSVAETRFHSVYVNTHTHKYIYFFVFTSRRHCGSLFLPLNKNLKLIVTFYLAFLNFFFLAILSFHLAISQNCVINFFLLFPQNCEISICDCFFECFPLRI